MKISRKAVILGRRAVLVLLFFPAALQAGVPTDQVRSTVDRVLEILKDAKLASPGAKQERRNRLRQVIYPRFDFAEMSRRSLGPAWRRISPTEQTEFVQLFTQLLEQSYITNIEGYKGEKIVYSGETQEPDYAEVDTKIFSQQREPIEVDYRLHKSDGDWKVYDVVIENVSMVNNYRAQFTRLLDQGSFQELLDRIREKVAAAQ